MLPPARHDGPSWRKLTPADPRHPPEGTPFHALLRLLQYPPRAGERREETQNGQRFSWPEDDLEWRYDTSLRPDGNLGDGDSAHDTLSKADTSQISIVQVSCEDTTFTATVTMANAGVASRPDGEGPGVSTPRPFLCQFHGPMCKGREELIIWLWIVSIFIIFSYGDLCPSRWTSHPRHNPGSRPGADPQP